MCYMGPSSKRRRSREKDGGDLGPPKPGSGKEIRSVSDVWLHHWRVLGDEDNPLSDVEDNVGRLHTSSCRTSS